MSATPPKKLDVEPGVQSPDGSEPPMDRDAQDTQAQGLDFEVKEQDRWLPIANVARIMKLALPDNAKIAKEAKECMQECVSEFISFITSEASEKCQQEKRKTVNGEDILFAMTSLGFENYAEALKIYLSRYRETLLANQNKPAAQFVNTSGAPGSGGPVGGASASSAGPTGNATSSYSSAENANNNNNGNLLSSDLAESGDTDNTAFGYSVHNGSGDAGF